MGMSNPAPEGQNSTGRATDSEATVKQALPTGNDSVPIGYQVMWDIEQRMAMGKETYGRYLQANNGRNALVDAYQECLDLACYLKQRIIEEAESGTNQS